MKTETVNTPSEEQIERLLESVPPEMGGQAQARLASAPWTPWAASRRKTTWVVTAACTILFLGFFASPTGRAWAQNVFRFFHQASSDTLPLEPWQMTAVANYQLTTSPVMLTMTPGSEPGYAFTLTLDEASQASGFAVLVPSAVPNSLTFEGASYEPDHQIVRLHYRHTDFADASNGLILREERYKTNDDCDLCGLIGASQAIEEVTIDDTTGEYAEGVWTLTDNGPVWEGTPFMKTLRWQKDDMAFELQYMGIPDSVMVVDKSALIAIAESVK